MNNSKSAKFLKNIQSIPKSAGLKGITMSDKDVPNLKDSIKISINSGVLTNFSSSLKSIKPLDNSQGYKTLSKIMEASSEANESQEKKTIMLNNLSDDGSEYDNTIKHDTTKHMEQVDEVIEDLYDLFLMIGCSIIEELPEEINIKVHSTGNIIKVSKVLFTQFTAGSPTSQDESCSPAYNIVVASSSVARRESRDLGKVQLVAHPKSINTNFTQENGKFCVSFFKICKY